MTRVHLLLIINAVSMACLCFSLVQNIAGVAQAEPIQITGNGDTSFYGMEVESVNAITGGVEVVTTGAEYKIYSDRLEMWRRIDPKTNTINPKKIAELEFESLLNDIAITGYNKRQANISSDKVEFRFNSDSFFFVEAKTDFNYVHRNLITDPPWNKGSFHDRIWTDGYGGSLHSFWNGSPEVTEQGSDYTRIAVSQDDTMAHMAFPPKMFNFSRLYGESARPFIKFVGVNDYFNQNLEKMKKDGYGVFMLWATFYNDSGVLRGEAPTMLDVSFSDHEIRGYKFWESMEDEIIAFIELAHQKGYKVITYLSCASPVNKRWYYPSGHPREGEYQEINITLRYMKEFQEKYDLDGWYFDNSDAGDITKDYYFIRTVREDIGDSAIIYNHDSVDVWDPWLNYSGRRAIMIDAYVDYTLTGETDYATFTGGVYNGLSAQVDSPNDPYYRFFTSGYGLSQAFGSHKIKSIMDCAMSQKESFRVMGQNLNTADRFISTEIEWKEGFKDFYDIRREEYNKSLHGQGIFNPDVSWPIDTTTGWFRDPLSIEILPLTGTSFRIAWNTHEPADTKLAHTSNRIWWYTYNENIPDGPDDMTKDTTLTYQHSKTISYLKENTDYEFRIRSSNKKSGPEEIIWGHVGNFRTGNSDEDSDGMADDWELEYFNTMTRTGTSDFDNDGLLDLEEFNIKTNPASSDSDWDGFNDYYEYENGYDYLDWTDPSTTCNNNGICQNGNDGETPENCPNDCKSGLLAFHSFDYGNAWDQSGDNRHATVYKAQWVENGRYEGNGAFKFEGDQFYRNYIELDNSLADNKTFGGVNGNVTITAWVKADDANLYNYMFHNVGGCYYFSFGSYNAGPIFIAMVRDLQKDVNYWPRSISTIESNEWVHVTLILESGSGYRLYINGILDFQQENKAIGIYNYGEVPYLGLGGSTDSHFNGMIDEVMIWNRSLTNGEICDISGKYWDSGNCQDFSCNFDGVCDSNENFISCPSDCIVCRKFFDPLGLADNLRTLFVDSSNCNCDNSYSRQDALNPSTPWCSIQAGADNMAPGDTLLVREGTYNEGEIHIGGDCGSRTNPAETVTVKRYGEEDVEITCNGCNTAVNLLGNYVVFDGFEISDASLYGIQTQYCSNERSHDVTIRNCKIHNITKDAIKFHSDDMIIDNNEIYDAGEEGIDCAVGCHDAVIRNNDLHNIESTALFVKGGGKRAKIYNNTIHDTKYGISLGGATLWERIRDSEGEGIFEGFCQEAYNNLIYNISPGAAIQFRGCRDCKAYYNTVYKTHAFVRSNFGAEDLTLQNTGIEIKNNIFSHSLRNFYYNFVDVTHDEIESKNNVFFGLTGSAIAFIDESKGYNWSQWKNLGETDSYNSYPVFYDLSTFNFRLRPNSPAINNGICITGVNQDFDGVSRPQGNSCDIGAFELHADNICNTGADSNCDGEISMTELIIYMDSWYKCSSCIPDLIDAFSAFFKSLPGTSIDVF